MNPKQASTHFITFCQVEVMLHILERYTPEATVKLLAPFRQEFRDVKTQWIWFIFIFTYVIYALGFIENVNVTLQFLLKPRPQFR